MICTVNKFALLSMTVGVKIRSLVSESEVSEKFLDLLK